MNIYEPGHEFVECPLVADSPFVLLVSVQNVEIL